MLLSTRLLLIGALGVAATHASATDPMPAISMGAYAEAAIAAADYADPVARTLVLYYRLLAPGGGDAAEIAAFQATHPDWPNPALLERRRQEAIAREPDQAAALVACGQDPTSAGALARCADALAANGETGQASTDARRAWVVSVAPASDAAGFLARWASVLRPEDETARFDRLTWTNNPEAIHQIARLTPPERAAAHVRLALRRQDPNAWERLDKLPPAARAVPALVLDEARWLRHAGRTADAIALWKARGFAAELGASPERRAAYWAERNSLARRVLMKGDPANAYILADDTAQTAAEPAAAAAFLAGFIALRKNADPASAAADFVRLANGKAAITQARAHYWLARALAARGDDPAPDDAKAAAFPLTFYGQLAARAAGVGQAALDSRIRGLTDPGFTTEAAWSFTGRDLVRAAAMLSAWGESGRARGFLMRAQETATDPAQQALAARLALGLGMPDTAVFIARRMGIEGLALPNAGWPEPVSPPPGPPNGTLDPALTLALIRQESSFDPGAVSAAGARGLMQLMPATAAVVARRTGGAVTEAALTADPARNMALGTGFMADMLTRFGGSLPLAIAAYNAGPHRVDQWLRENGDPRAGGVAMLDWIELIPFDETRNYVERVLENVVIYQARLGEAATEPSARWMR